MSNNTNMSTNRRNLFTTFNWDSLGDNFIDNNYDNQKENRVETESMDRSLKLSNDKQNTGFGLSPKVLSARNKTFCKTSTQQTMNFFVSVSPIIADKKIEKTINLNYLSENEENESPFKPSFNEELFNDSLEDDEDDRRKTFLIGRQFPINLKRNHSIELTDSSKKLKVTKISETKQSNFAKWKREKLENQTKASQTYSCADSFSSKLSRDRSIDNSLCVAPIDNINVCRNDFEFAVPSKLPPKLKKKLTPSKLTPARRPSMFIKRSAITGTPLPYYKTGGHIKFATTVKKRRSSSGTKLSPKNRLNDTKHLTTPSSISKIIQFEDEFDREESGYINWLNVMLTPKLDVECINFDEKELINECFDNKSLQPIQDWPTKEDMSYFAYNEAKKMDNLRFCASELYKSEDIKKLNDKVDRDIEKNKFAIRKDKAIHADVGIKKHILELLLAYNPLWLRIGLETIFGQTIKLSANTDAKGLTKFIAQNFLSSPQLVAKYCHKNVSNFFKDERHENEAKNYILKKFLQLINFLDYGKQRRLIQHDPCLFQCRAKYKSTLSILVSFAREYITGVGNIVNHLKSFRFSLDFKQKPIEEFDFSVSNLAIDLRCGIRLTRLAELLFQTNDLLPQLQFPTNNKTRKQYNMKIAFNAFKDIIPEDITYKDIVNGHRKKTLELLSAIVFKHKMEIYIADQAVNIQKVVFIQRKIRAVNAMKQERHKYLQLKAAAIFIQRKFRANKLIKLEKNRLLSILNATLLIQRRWRANKTMKFERNYYLTLIKSTAIIQTRFRANKLMRIEKTRYDCLRACVVFIQQRFKANCLMKIERTRYKSILNATLLIQKQFKASKAMKLEKEKYLKLKQMATRIQRRFRANKLMKTEKNRYQSLLSATALIQQRFRANCMMKRERVRYVSILNATILIQRKYRANVLMKREQNQFKSILNATLLVQRKWRANKSMKSERNNYLTLLKCAVIIQRRFRANQMMKLEKNRFDCLRSSVVLIQQRFKANYLMKVERSKFRSILNATLLIQNKFKASKAMKLEREKYLKLKQMVLYIQRRVRANKLMNTEKNRYKSLLSATALIQQRFRANCMMKRDRARYISTLNAAILIQRKFRSNLIMKLERNRYLTLLKFTAIIQRKYRANQLMKLERNRFLSILNATLFIQRKWRANKAMIFERNKYRTLLRFTVIIQRRFHSRYIIKQNLLSLERSAVTLQAAWRGYKTRKMIHESNRQLENVFKRVLESASNATEEMRLGNRTDCALQKLLTYKYLLPLSNELQSLYVTTNLSPESCITIANNEAVTVLVQILKESNRSEPHKKIVYFVIGILLNLAKFAQTLPKVNENCEIIDLIFKIIKSFNRQEDIMKKAVSLAWILLRDQNNLNSVMQRKHICDSIKKLHNSSVYQQKKGREARLTKQKLVNLKFSPNWQIANTSVYQFNDISYAIKCLAFRMNIKKKIM